MTAPVVVLGAGGHARVVADACQLAGYSVRGFLSREAPGTIVVGLPVLGGDELFAAPGFLAAHHFVPAVGDQRLRRRLASLVDAGGGTLTTIRHPSAVIARDVSIGAGSVLLAGAVVNSGSTLGRFVIVNTAATVDHDGVLEDGVQIGPGAHLGGHVTCREDATIGMGATVLPGRTVGRSAVVGAGAVVTADVPEEVVVIGCPARIWQRGQPGEEGR